MDIFQKINDGDYDPKIPHPGFLSKPKMPRNPTSAQAQAYTDALIAYEELKPEYNAKLAEYKAESDKLLIQFKQDCFSVVLGENAENFPNVAEWCWSKAWEDGHSGGYSDVYNQLIDCSALINAIIADVSIKE